MDRGDSSCSLLCGREALDMERPLVLLLQDAVECANTPEIIYFTNDSIEEFDH